MARNFAGDFPRGFTSLVASLVIISCCGVVSHFSCVHTVPGCGESASHVFMRARAAELELRRPTVSQPISPRVGEARGPFL